MRQARVSLRLAFSVRARTPCQRAYFKHRPWLMRLHTHTHTQKRTLYACYTHTRARGLEPVGSRAPPTLVRVYRAYESCDLAHALYACLHAPTVARHRRDAAYSSQLFDVLVSIVIKASLILPLFPLFSSDFHLFLSLSRRLFFFSRSKSIDQRILKILSEKFLEYWFFIIVRGLEIYFWCPQHDSSFSFFYSRDFEDF